ncbi:MAG: hypothetical protein L3J67_02490 [Hyphomicrobiaceae bacterium]|nr:hypothetical protein [Hyphomicrobiaceae bacterium]
MLFPSAQKIAFGLMLIAMSIVSGQVSAQNQQDYCIKCTNPGETYICRVVSNSNSAQGKQLLCIMNIAREHGHDSCAATTQSQSCSGVLVQYEVSGTMTTPGPPRPVNSALATPSQTAPPQRTTGEPRTLVEFTKKATKATKKSFKSAGKDTSKAFKKTGKKITKFTKKVGKNITKATKTTWKCITSLFFSCNSN